MRRDFTAISGFSMAISFVAAVVLCLQISQTKAAPEWAISGATVWAVELAIFGTAIYAWRPNVSLSGWMLGILSLVLVSLSLTTSTAAVMAFIQGSGDFPIAMARASTMGPRVCAAFFSLMVFYPLRLLLPIRRDRKVNGKRFAKSEAAMASPAEGDPSVLLVGGDQSIPVWEAKNRPAAERQSGEQFSSVEIEGSVDLPLDVLLAQIPRDMWGEGAEGYSASLPVPIPLEVIVPQLKEARVVMRIGEVRQLLPPDAMLGSADTDPGREDGLILLPLELIVPQLPPEALELPPPSPPAWANVDEDESVLFATLSAN